MKLRPPSLPSAGRRGALALLTAAVLVAVFSVMVVRFRAELRDEIHRKIIERDAAVLAPMAQEQVAESAAGEAGRSANPYAPLTAVLQSSHQQGMLAVAIFDRDGGTLEAMPATQLFVELPVDDFLRLQRGGSISRYHPAFPLDQYFAGIAGDARTAPVLEVLLALPAPGSTAPLGYVRYFIDARPLARELAVIDARIDRQTAITLGAGALVVGLVIAGAAYGVERARRAVDERNERLRRANFELSLAAKASAIGQITSHLIHGLQGSVQGLSEAVASREPGVSSPAWDSAVSYTTRLQAMIQETVALLSDAGAGTSYEIAGHELAAMLRERHAEDASRRGVVLRVDDGFPATIDGHRGMLLGLIGNNLIQNALAATPAGRHVDVALGCADGTVTLQVSDEGAGIPAAMREHLFMPGRSGRAGGSGLGLAISRLIARQIGAEIALVSTGPQGTVFRVAVPPPASR